MNGSRWLGDAERMLSAVCSGYPRVEEAVCNARAALVMAMADPAVDLARAARVARTIERIETLFTGSDNETLSVATELTVRLELGDYAGAAVTAAHLRERLPPNDYDARSFVDRALRSAERIGNA